MVDRYDRIIGGIAASLAGGIGIGLFTALTFEAGLLLGALGSTYFVYDAMFRHPPLPSSDARVAAAGVVWHAFLGVLMVAVYLG